MSLPCLFRIIFSLILISWLSVSCDAQTGPKWSAKPFSPPALPLAVRSPYLNAWLPQGYNPASISSSWPNLWTTKSILGWYAAVQVDNATYQVLGDANLSVTGNILPMQQAVEFTATRTSFLFKAGAADVNMTFLSPIEPTDLVRQSIPFAYMYIDVSSNDGFPHDVKLYSDISAEWVSGDDSLVVNWQSNTTAEAIILMTQLENPTPFAEILDHAQDAVAYYSMNYSFGVSWQIGQGILLRHWFNATGFLNNTVDTNFRPVSNDQPVFGISIDLGNITSTSSPVVWSIGLIRDPCIQTLTSTGSTEYRSSYFWSNYSTDIEVVESVLSDFDRALNAAIDFDTQLRSNASQISTEYAGLVALAVRQVLGSLDITLSKNDDGDWNTSDVKVFMKNFNPVGASGGVNAVDVMFSAFPVFVALNPDLGKYLLAPLLEYQSSALSPNTFAVQDIGANYPNATAHDINPPNLGIEESANMIIMGLAYTQTSGDDSLITAYYDLFQQWADYLVDNSLIPLNQFTSDELPASNQTNLAIKSIIGIRAMSRMSQYTGNTDNVTYYQNVSDTYLSQWQSLAMSSDNSHILADYNEQTSSALIYNLYADKLLQLGLIPESIYETQTAFYGQQQISAIYGLPFDSSEVQTRSDWMMFTAATVTQAATRDTFVSFIHDYSASNQNRTPFALEYNPFNGLVPSASGGINSAAQGAMFSLLALSVPLQNVTSSTNSSGSKGSSNTASKSSSTNVGAIVGGILGGLLFIGLLATAVLLVRRRRRMREGPVLPEPATHLVHSPQMIVEPFSVPLGVSQGVEYSTSAPHSPVESGGVANTGNLSRRIFPEYTTPSKSSIILSSDVTAELRRRAAPLPSASDVTISSECGLSRWSGTTRRQGMLAKQTLVNEQLRTEVENIRRDMERIREDRVENILVEVPPSYF